MDGHNSLLKTVTYYTGVPLKFEKLFDKDGELRDVTIRGHGYSVKVHTKEVNGKKMKYLTLSKRVGNRAVVLIMNSPKLLNREVVEFYSYIQKHPVVKGLSGEPVREVHGFKLRGHGIPSITNTGAKIFKNMREIAGHDIPLASYGSCGGNRYGVDIAKVSPGSLYSGFTSTGMAYVNLNLQRGELEFILHNGYYDTRGLQKDADNRFKKYSDRMRRGYSSFRWAHQNVFQKLIVAFQKIKEIRGK